MIKFIRENSGIIIKFMMTHLVMSLLGLMVGLAILVVDGDTTSFTPIALIAGAFTVGFMLFMHYDDSFFCGVKEGIKCRADGVKPDQLRGLKISLIGSLPILVVGVIAILVIICTPEGKDANPVALLLFYFMQASYLSLYGLLDYIGIIGFVCLTPIPAIVASALGHWIGCNDKTLRGLMGMKVKPPFDGPLERKPKNKN